MKIKRMIAALTAIALLPVSAVFAVPVKSDEKITLIVEVSGDAVLEAEHAAACGVGLFSKTEEARNLENSIKSRQMQVMSEIDHKVDSTAEIGFTYSYVFNGFSLEAYESDIERIKALPNVENVYVGTGTAEEFGGADVRNKIALMDSGEGLSFALRIKNAKDAGAVGAVFINRENALNIGIVQASLQDIPTAAVLLSDGEKMKNAAHKTLKTTERIQSEIIHSDTVSMSYFSSWGVNSSLELKPEITAPGGNIYSSVNNDKYEMKAVPPWRHPI